MFCYICIVIFVFFFKQKTAYEMRISDWSSDVCSSDLEVREFQGNRALGLKRCRHSAREIVDVGHMGIDVVANDEVRLLTRYGQTFAQCLAKELTQHRDRKSVV